MYFCAEIEHNQKLKEEYHNHLEKIKNWYVKSVEYYSTMLSSELLFNAMKERVGSFDGVDNIFDLTYQFSTKTSFFSVSDALVKLILSMYSIGPSDTFFSHYGIVLNSKLIEDIRELFRRGITPTWIKDKTEESGMAEILARVLLVKGVPLSFDLKSLMVDRGVRSTLTHAAKDEVCYS